VASIARSHNSATTTGAGLSGNAATTQPRAAIYVRVSTAGQQEDGTSPETQEAECRAYAARHGLVVSEPHVYREVHTGAELWQRPLLTRLRAAMRWREVDAVVVHAIDRLSRDPVHLGVVLSEAE
jgi:DNA invertase Pin-like site-specific DNA recombinase